MPKMLRRTAVIAVLLGAWALVGSDQVPLPFHLGSAQAETGASSAVEAKDGQYDLSALRVYTKVILYIKDNYVDPQRVKPKEMMISSLEYVEKTVPDVLVEGSAETNKLIVNVNGKVRDWDISHVDSLWKMSWTLKDVFKHLNENMRKSEELRDVEYAAVNGMLSTLDPHSVLLRPEVYREMRLSTKGEFGGLGFVIQMKEGNLTVVKVLPKTPAHRAGIKKDDRIKRIGEESTVNMDLNEAVSKLRGPVDSKVTLTIERGGWEKNKAMTLARAMISIESVQSKMLEGNVGYIRLKNFQGNTTRDLRSALSGLKTQAQASGGLKGVVLDMRGNPGGLLEQAIQVSDTFLSSGTIVSTVGLSDKLREEKKARPEPEDVQVPLAVLVNAGSASASEIVAGALKNLDRAVIIGRQTFGKGSVQVLYDFPDDSALKLTIAKYLTPGDVSIQEVGIVPDIVLTPTRVSAERVDVYAPRKSMGEADLDQHFGNVAGKAAATKREEVLGREKPAEELKYLKIDPKEAAQAKAEEVKKGGHNPLLDADINAGEDLDDQLDAESQDEIKEDFEVKFARDFVLKAPALDRQQMLKVGRAFVHQKRTDEEQRISKAIEQVGIDWTRGARPKSVQLATRLTPGADKVLNAGEVLEMEVSVQNKGSEPIHRLRGWTKSENPMLDHREFLFGMIKPGETKSWKVPIKLPKDLTSRADGVSLSFHDDQGALTETLNGELAFAELPRPAFAFNYQVLDTCESCNGDGITQRGEQVELLLNVTNNGAGAALDSYATIKNVGDPNVFIEKGRFKIGELKAGETKTAKFALEVKRAFKGDTYPIKLAIIDEPLEEFTTEKLSLPVAPSGAELEKRKGVVKLGNAVKVYGAASAHAAPLFTLEKGGVLQTDGALNGFVRVRLEDQRFGFVRAADAKDGRGKAQAPKNIAWLPSRTPPEITLTMDGNRDGLVTEGERFTLTGTVKNPTGLLDMYVLVNDQKVFFKSAETGKADRAAKDGQQSLTFTTDFPLKEGNNNVLVVARESEDFASRRLLVIRRRPEAVAQKGKTPVANPQ